MKMMATAALVAGAAVGAAAAAQAQPVQAGVVHVQQPPAVQELLRRHIAYNARHPKVDGYRIRIYRDNLNNPRGRAEALVAAFGGRYADVPAYLSYDNPYWKVSVGDFRSKDEAMKFFARVKRSYPNAYIVAEEINFPPL